MFSGKTIRWYGDDSDYNWGKHEDGKIPDLWFFGGFVIPIEQEQQLTKKILEIKADYGAKEYHPVKWNFRDLKKDYSKLGAEETYQILLDNSQAWRLAILECLNEIDCKIVVAIVHAHGKTKETIKTHLEDFSRFAFKNALQRIGLLAQESNPNKIEVILDWPNKGEKGLFEEVYHAGCFAGVENSYKCGNLADIGFSTGLMFSSMKTSHMVQVADLIIGATREFVASKIDGKDDKSNDHFWAISKHFRGYPLNILGQGISISRGAQSKDMKSKLYRAFVNKFIVCKKYQPS